MTRISRSADKYETITVTVHDVTQKGVRISNSDQPKETWIGRSCLSYVSDEEVESKFQFPLTMELEIQAWVLKKEGFI